MKTVHCVYTNNFFPELWHYTYPLLENYARKINARLNIITENKYPNWHPNYEKLQVYEHGRNSDANLLVDADVLIHPDFPDFTSIVPEHHVAFNENYHADSRFETNDYFLRDGRNVGIATNVLVSYKSTHDIWEPLTISPELAYSKIITGQKNIVDEYCLSLNLAKYGLKYCGICWEDWQRYYLVHTGTGDRRLAINMAAEMMREWKQNVSP